MRRSTRDSSYVALEQQKLLGRLHGLDHGAIAAALEPFVTAERRARLLEVFGARLDAVTVLMDAPYDPHNGAAVLRSCDAFGIQRLHVVERNDIKFLAARQVARGSEQWVDVHAYPTSDKAIAALRASGHTLIGTHPKGDLGPADLRHVARPCLVLGNERDGIHAELSAACEKTVRIPMRGFAESLNVSVTGAVLLQYATDGRPGDLPEAERLFLFARALVLTVDHAAEILVARGIRIGQDEPEGAAIASGTSGSLAPSAQTR
jgi:tRNA (guanosine-2'-O-)-methyltransferase